MLLRLNDDNGARMLSLLVEFPQSARLNFGGAGISSSDEDSQIFRLGGYTWRLPLPVSFSLKSDVNSARFKSFRALT